MCGSPVPVDVEGAEYIGMLAGVLDGELGSDAFRHIFLDQSAPWHTVADDDLPRFDERPPANERLRGKT